MNLTVLTDDELSKLEQETRGKIRLQGVELTEINKTGNRDAVIERLKEFGLEATANLRDIMYEKRKRGIS